MLGARSLLWWGGSVPSVSHIGFSQSRTREQSRQFVINVTALISPVVIVGLCQCPSKVQHPNDKNQKLLGCSPGIPKEHKQMGSQLGVQLKCGLCTAIYYESSQSAYQIPPDPESSRSACIGV